MKAVYRTAAGAVVVLAIAWAGWKTLPIYIKGRVERGAPGTTVGEAHLRPWYLDLRNVTVSRPGLSATLPRVTVQRDRAVHIDGGEVAVNMGQPRASASTTGHKVSFTNIKVTATMSTVTVTATGVSGSLGGTIAADLVTAKKIGMGTAAIKNATRLTSSSFRAESATLHEFSPLPTDPCREVLLEGLEYDWATRHGEAETVTCGGNRADGVSAQEVRRGHWTAKAQGIVISHPWLHPKPLAFSYPMSFSWDGKMLEGFVGEARTKTGLTIAASPAEKTLTLTGDCAEVPLRLPPPLAEPLGGIAYTGTFDLHVRIDKTPGMYLKADCRAACASPRLQELRGKFTYWPHDAKWNRVKRVSGPGSREWVPLPLISHTMPTAVIAMEDPGFTSHRGWINQALHNSLLINLEAGKFQRGGSTITMQVAKNLWLSRDKTLGRKAQEILLAMALESCLTKDQILELYLNIIEYGPDLYGIGPASRRWFDTSPMGLSSRQAIWLASILPKPRSATKPDERTLARMESLVQRLVESGHIPEMMLETIPEGADAGW